MSAPSADEKQEVARRIEAVESLSSPPASLDRILSLSGDAESSVDQLGRAIELDPAITARVLRLANSAYFGFSRHVETVDEAIMVIGFRNVRNLAACAAVAPVFTGAGSGLDRTGLWRHSCAVAEGSRLIAAHRGQDDGWAYVAGLLHDLGQVVLEEVMGLEYPEILSRERQGASLTAIELGVLGVDHAWAGATLCERWQLSERIAGAVGRHHGPHAPEGGSALVALAECLAAEQDLDDPSDPIEASRDLDPLRDLLALSGEELEALRGAFAERREAILLLHQETT